MSTQRMIVVLALMLFAAIGGLVYLAMGGNTYATSILFAVWSIFCVVIGWLLSYVQIRTQASREEKSFINNAKENLAMMSAMQTVQNKQNQTLMQQVRRLPESTNNDSGLEIVDGLFDELEN